MDFKTSFTVMGDPVAKPRQTHKDRWKPSPGVQRYRDWADECRVECTGAPDKKVEGDFLGVIAIAHFALSESWSQKKKDAHYGRLHRQRPDNDNILKSVQDALFEEDSQIAWGQCIKMWVEKDAEPHTDIYILGVAFLPPVAKKK